MMSNHDAGELKGAEFKATPDLAGVRPENRFYREDIDESECVISEDNRPAVWVNVDYHGDVICNKHRLEMTPRERRSYIRIEDVPYKTPRISIAENIFNEDGDAEDEDFNLTDSDV